MKTGAKNPIPIFVSLDKSNTHTHAHYTHMQSCAHHQTGCQQHQQQHCTSSHTDTTHTQSERHGFFWEWMMDVILNWKMRWLVLVIIDAVGGRVVGRKHEGHGEKNAEC